jgi:ribosomal protein S18 acetylase RimI-like enzyme
MISVHRLGEEEWQRGKAIRLRALEDSPDAFGRLLGEELLFDDGLWQERLSRPNVATFVAVMGEGGDDAGLVTGAPYDEAVGLFSMWVAPEARGRGVGGALIDTLVDWARSNGNSELLLDVGDDNEPAIALYRRKGFERTGVIGTLPSPREYIAEHQRRRVL